MTNAIDSLILDRVNAIVNAVELNDRHGVGILLNRIFANTPNLIAIRTLNIYGGGSTVGNLDIVLGGRGWSRQRISEWISSRLANYQFERILCIPYYPEEIEIALAIQSLTNAPICTYLMDDRNILIDDISDRLMSELLSKSRSILGISPEMCDMYSAKYRVPVYFAPPVLPANLVNTETSVPSDALLKLQKGIIIGNIWSTNWLQLLRETIVAAGIEVDWYGNTGANWHLKHRDRLAAEGIRECGFLPTEAELVAVLRSYPYAIVPSGTLDERDNNQPTSWLSLPSRIVTILASANTPIIVLGNPNTAAARFVERLEIGYCVNYDADRLQMVVDEVVQPQFQQKFRQNAARIADIFKNDRMDEWIWQSLTLGQPIDDRFDKLLERKLDNRDALVTCMTSLRDRERQIDKLKFNIWQRIDKNLKYFKQSWRWQSIQQQINKFKVSI